jgi:hypothetical protein
MSESDGSSCWIWDVGRTEAPGFQLSIYWYCWAPLVSINIWRYGMTAGKVTTP